MLEGKWPTTRETTWKPTWKSRDQRCAGVRRGKHRQTMWKGGVSFKQTKRLVPDLEDDQTCGARGEMAVKKFRDHGPSTMRANTYERGANAVAQLMVTVFFFQDWFAEEN